MSELLPASSLAPGQPRFTIMDARRIGRACERAKTSAGLMKIRVRLEREYPANRLEVWAIAADYFAQVGLK